MKTTHHTFIIAINHHLEEVFNFFYDLKNHISLHPMMQKVEEQSSFVNKYGQLVSKFRIWEKIRFSGKFSYNHSCTVRRRLMKNQRGCVFEAKSFPNVRVTSCFTFVSDKHNGVLVMDKVIIKAPDLLSGYAVKKAKAAHETVLLNLKNHFEKQETVDIEKKPYQGINTYTRKKDKPSFHTVPMEVSNIYFS